MSGKTRSARSKKEGKSKVSGKARAMPGRGTRSKTSVVSKKKVSSGPTKRTGAPSQPAGGKKAPVSKSKRAKVAIATADEPVVRKDSADKSGAKKSVSTGRRSVKAVGTTAARPSSVRNPRAESGNIGPADVLARAETDIGSVIESLNTQMTIALSTLAELAGNHRGQGEAVIQTAPIDRATATFQRIVTEVVDDQLAEMLPLLVDLRNEMAGRCDGDDDSLAGDDLTADDDFVQRGTEMLDRVLATARVTRFDARPGEPFDPLIHLAVGETHRDDLADGTVAESLRSGFRSARGNLLSPARVKVNRG